MALYDGDNATVVLLDEDHANRMIEQVAKALDEFKKDNLLN